LTVTDPFINIVQAYGVAVKVHPLITVGGASMTFAGMGERSAATALPDIRDPIANAIIIFAIRTER
jgi:hypothetical protein